MSASTAKRRRLSNHIPQPFADDGGEWRHGWARHDRGAANTGHQESPAVAVRRGILARTTGLPPTSERRILPLSASPPWPATDPMTASSRWSPSSANSVFVDTAPAPLRYTSPRRALSWSTPAICLSGYPRRGSAIICTTWSLSAAFHGAVSTWTSARSSSSTAGSSIPLGRSATCRGRDPSGSFRKCSAGRRSHNLCGRRATLV